MSDKKNKKRLRGKRKRARGAKITQPNGRGPTSPPQEELVAEVGEYKIPLIPVMRLDTLPDAHIRGIEAGELPLNTQAFTVGLQQCGAIHLPPGANNQRDAIIVTAKNRLPRWEEAFSAGAQIFAEGTVWAAYFAPTHILLKDVSNMVDATLMHQLNDTVTAIVTEAGGSITVNQSTFGDMVEAKNKIVYHADDVNGTITIEVSPVEEGDFPSAEEEE